MAFEGDSDIQPIKCVEWSYASLCETGTGCSWAIGSVNQECQNHERRVVLINVIGSLDAPLTGEFRRVCSHLLELDDVKEFNGKVVFVVNFLEAARDNPAIANLQKAYASVVRAIAALPDSSVIAVSDDPMMRMLSSIVLNEIVGLPFIVSDLEHVHLYL